MAVKSKRPPVRRLTGIAALPSTRSRNTKPLTKSTAPTKSNARSDMQTPIFFRHACPWGGPRASTSCPRTTESKDFHSVGTLGAYGCAPVLHGVGSLDLCTDRQNASFIKRSTNDLKADR